MKQKRKSRGESCPSMGEIARACGVSIMTVSRVLRRTSLVREATRERILKIAESKGYHLRVHMGRPRQVESRNRPAVDVIVGMTTDIFFSRLLYAVEQALTQREHDCVVRTCNADYKQFLSLCETLRNSAAIGTLIVGYLPTEQLQTLLEMTPHAILVDHTGDSRITCPYETVGFDNVEAGRIMVRHLLTRNRRRILLIKGFRQHYFSREIEQGYGEALQDAGVDIDRELILESDFTPQSAFDRVGKALDSGLEFDAVFTNDEMACGVLRCLHGRGIGVPADVAVAGCDGLPLGQYTIPSLTTVLLDYRQLGQMAVESVCERLSRAGEWCRRKLIPRLEIRESTAQR